MPKDVQNYSVIAHSEIPGKSKEFRLEFCVNFVGQHLFRVFQSALVPVALACIDFCDRFPLVLENKGICPPVLGEPDTIVMLTAEP